MLKGFVHLINSDYNEETGVSKVLIDTDLGSFYGFAKLHPEDSDYASKFTGCRYAEIRATIKYLKMKQKIALYGLKLLNRVKPDKSVNLLQEEINKELEEVKKAIEFSINTLTTDIKERPELIKKIYSNKEDK
jgi:hypothetical protein